MQQKKRLTRLNQKPLHSLDELSQDDRSSFNLLDHIQNQNLYSKLVTLTLQISSDAGLPLTSLHELQSKLLAAKGLNQDMMLNRGSEFECRQKGKGGSIGSYNSSNRWLDSKEQIALINKMEKEVEESRAKENLVWALKKYIQEKKKAIEDGFDRNQNLTWKDSFNKKFNRKRKPQQLSRTLFYQASLRDILGQIHEASDESHTLISNMKHLKCLWGHTFNAETEEEYCPVYNAIFDSSQRLIITGGEDGLIKVWSKESGLLLSNLKGHKDYINKINITKCNKYLLSAGNDCIRFFDLTEMTSLSGFDVECIMDIAAIHEGKDFKVIFADKHRLFVLEDKTLFNHKNVKLEPHDFQLFNFKDKVKEDTINTVLFTVNDNKEVLMGMSSGQILYFNFHHLFENPQEIEEQYRGAPQFSLPLLSVIQAHEADILEIKWDKDNFRFATGGKKDGCCRIWDLESMEELRKPSLARELKIPKYKIKRKKKTYHCNFISYNCTYTYLACSFQEEEIDEDSDLRGDGEIIVYGLQKHEVTWEFSRQFELASVRGLEFHPLYPNIMLIGDSYGKIILADIYLNSVVNIFEERGIHLGHPSFCVIPTECKFSQDGNFFLVSTEYGNVSLYGYDVKDFYDRVPMEQFFQNDYENIEIDPVSFKPFMSPELPIDVNEMDRGRVKNSRLRQYLNLMAVDTKEYKKNLDLQYEKNEEKDKLKHRNKVRLSEETLTAMRQCNLEYERSMEVYRSNYEQLEHKRLTILYEEKQSKNEKLKEIIQEKVSNLKDLEQGNTLPMPSFQKEWESNKQPNRRTRGRSSTIIRRDNNEFYQDEEGPEIEEEESFHVDEKEGEEYEENVSENYLDEELEDEHYDSEQSESSIFQTRARNNRLKRPVRTTRRYIPRNRQQRRPVNEELEQLEQEFDEYNRTRKRFHREEDDQEMDYDFIEREEPRKPPLKEKVGFCDECKTKEWMVECYICKGKKYCEFCKGYEGKKLLRNHEYACFECIYENNTARQRKKNKTDEKYRGISRQEAFMPQIGDHVAYFFQGYEEFLHQKIQFLNNKYFFTEDKFSLRPHKEIPELCQPQRSLVKNVTFLNPLESEFDSINIHKRGARGRFTRPTEDIFALVKLCTEDNIEFEVFYVTGEEFLLKWEIYEDIITNDRLSKLKEFDLVFLKDEEVQIMSKSPVNMMYPYSIWKCITIHKTENKNLRRQKENSVEMRINLWNLSSCVDESAFKFRSSFGEDKIEHYAIQILKIEHEDLEGWEIFSNFVNTEIFKDYYEKVQVGVCLNLILERLRNQYYKSEESFIRDVNRLFENSVIYNGQLAYVTEKAKSLVNMILFDAPLREEMLNEPIEQIQEPMVEVQKASSEKKGTKKKKNTQAKQKEEFEEHLEHPVVNSFEEHELKRETRNKRKRYNESEEEEFKDVKSFEKEDSEEAVEYGLGRRKTRNMIKSSYRTEPLPQPSRLTRSKTRK